MNSRNPAFLNRGLESVVEFMRLQKVNEYGNWLWRRAGGWSQALAVALVTMLGLQLFMRVMAFLTVWDRGWTVCWRLSGVTAACMLRTQRHRWPWILSGLALSLLWTGIQIHAPAGDTAISSAANLLEVCVVAFGLPAFRGVQGWVRTPHITWRFTAIALVLAPMAGAVTAAGYFAHRNHCSYMQSAVFWWLGDSLGMVLWLPMALVVTTHEFYALFHWRSLPRTLALLGFLSTLSWFVFFTKTAPFAFAIMPVLLWIGLKLGFSGSVLATNILALIATSGTLAGLGPFPLMHSDPNLQVRALQIFLMVAMLMALPISVILLEREAFATQLQDAYRKMELQAAIDPLTGIANRRRFGEALHQEWQRAIEERRPIALLMVDADLFKAYNDFYGHPAGDEVLCRIVNAMLRVVHRPADVVARYGGEEFSILLPGTDEAGTRFLAESVRAAILQEQIGHIQSAIGFVTVSIGCWSIIPAPNSDSSMLIGEADAALYAAKNKGRNRVEYGRASTTASL